MKLNSFFIYICMDSIVRSVTFWSYAACRWVVCVGLRVCTFETSTCAMMAAVCSAGVTIAVDLGQ